MGRRGINEKESAIAPVVLIRRVRDPYRVRIIGIAGEEGKAMLALKVEAGQ